MLPAAIRAVEYEQDFLSIIVTFFHIGSLACSIDLIPGHIHPMATNAL
jgi:hypothetical protein